MIMTTGRGGGPRGYAQAPLDPQMAQIHAAYQSRIADLERELAAARQYIARLQVELAGRGQGDVRPAPPATPIPARWDPTPGPSAEIRAFYGDHLGCEHPYDIGSDEMEE